MLEIKLKKLEGSAIDSFKSLRAIESQKDFSAHKLDGLFDGLWEWDLEKKELNISKSFWKLFGIEPELSNCNITNLKRVIVPEDQHLLKKHFRRNLKEGHSDTIKLELRGIHKNQSTIWLFCNARVRQRNSSGRVIKIAGTLTDITDLKVEQRKNDINHRLAAIAEMAGNISHEINNPLAIANISVDWITKALNQNAFDPASIAEKLATTKKSIKRASGIVESLKLYTKSNFNSDLKRDKYIHNIINVTLSFLTPRAYKHNIEIINLVNKEIILFCNESQISYIFHSVIANIINSLVESDQSKIIISSLVDKEVAVISFESPSKCIDKDDDLNVSKSILESQEGSLRLIENQNSINVEVRLPVKKLKTS